jgi:hypothetical protein
MLDRTRLLICLFYTKEFFYFVHSLTWHFKGTYFLIFVYISNGKLYPQNQNNQHMLIGILSFLCMILAWLIRHNEAA